MELLSFRQFAERFPLECEHGDDRWAALLQRWRAAGKLKQYRDWKDGYVAGKMSRVYLLRPVVRLLCLEAKSDHCRPTVSYLVQENYQAFCEILEGPSVWAVDAVRSADKQASVLP